jgi:2-oxo-3-hexenedioate decarboxylase/2-keto-4-pentenoate hydratase
MDDAAIEEAAEVLAEARIRGRVVGPLPPDCRPADEAAGYAVQAAVHARLTESGWGEIAGWKLGCTTAVMQEHLGIANPTYGAMWARSVHRGDRDLQLADFRRPGVECEIAVRLDERLAPEDAPFDRAHIEHSVGACMVAAEVVDDRYADFRDLGAPTLIADDFFHAAAVLGEPREDWRDLDLSTLKGRTYVDNNLAGEGTGADVMGHPLDALVWLANGLSAQSRGLEAGQVVLTGSVVATQWLTAAATVEVEVDGLGRLRLGFA